MIIALNGKILIRSEFRRMNYEIERLDSHRLLVNKDFVELLKFNGIETARDLWDFEGKRHRDALLNWFTYRLLCATHLGGCIPEGFRNGLGH